MRILQIVYNRLFPHRWKSLLVFYIFIIFLVIGIAVHRDYGVSADEPALRKFGNDVFAYLFQGGPIPAEQDWAFYNPVVQVVMRGIELGLGLTDGADIWFIRHLITFLMFFATIIAFYSVARRRFGDWKLPLLGSAMFFLSPRLFAHGFYNPKDIPAMLFFTLSVWTLLRLMEKQTVPRLIVHVLCTAIVISTRVFGLVIPAVAMVLWWACVDPPRPRKATLSVIYFLALVVFLIVVWPLLWHDPLGGLIGAFMNNTSREGGGFYFGQQVSAAGVPWHYLPVWMGITTPVFYSVFFAIGLGALGIRFVRKPLKFLREEPAAGLALLWFSLPVAALMFLPIGIFDEWRHMLFLYPAFLLIALEGIAWIGMVTKRKWIAPTLIGLQLLSTGAWMIRNHPFEYAYFSIPTRFIDGKFELDYWGLSYRAGLEWIVEHDKRDRIHVYVAARTGKAAADTLPLKDWNRLYFVEDLEEADYVLDNFRGSGYTHTFPEEKNMHAITVDGMEILGVYRGRDTL